MSEYVPIPFPTPSPFRFATSLMNETTEVKAMDLSGRHLDWHVYIPVVTRDAHLPTMVYGQIRRVHQHTDAVEVDVTSTDPDFTEWDTFTIQPHAVVYIHNKGLVIE